MRKRKAPNLAPQPKMTLVQLSRRKAAHVAQEAPRAAATAKAKAVAAPPALPDRLATQAAAKAWVRRRLEERQAAAQRPASCQVLPAIPEETTTTRLVDDFEEVARLLQALLRVHPQGIAIADIRRQLKTQFGADLDLQKLGAGKLTMVLLDVRLANACRLVKDVGGFRVLPLKQGHAVSTSADGSSPPAPPAVRPAGPSPPTSPPPPWRSPSMRPAPLPPWRNGADKGAWC